jgi:hypothetical protein
MWIKGLECVTFSIYQNAFNILNYIEIWFDEVSWVSSIFMEMSMRYDLWILWWVNVFMMCLKREWIAYDIKWCISVWKHGHNGYMAWKHEHRTKSWTLSVRPFGLKLHQ